MFRCRPSFGRVIPDLFGSLRGFVGWDVGRFFVSPDTFGCREDWPGTASAGYRFPVVGRPSGVVFLSLSGFQSTGQVWNRAKPSHEPIRMRRNVCHRPVWPCATEGSGLNDLMSASPWGGWFMERFSLSPAVKYP